MKNENDKELMEIVEEFAEDNIEKLENKFDEIKDKPVFAKIKTVFTQVCIYSFIILFAGLVGMNISSKQWEGKYRPLEDKYNELLNTDLVVVDEEFISGKLENISELTTQKLTYSGLLQVEKGKIPFITKNGFIMVYTAQLEAYIDLSLAEINCNEKTVTIELPAAQLKRPHVLSETIEFYSEKYSLFNWDKKDVTDAIALAENDVRKKGDTTQLLTQADNNAKLLVENMFMELVGDKQLTVISKAIV